MYPWELICTVCISLLTIYVRKSSCALRPASPTKNMRIIFQTNILINHIMQIIVYVSTVHRIRTHFNAAGHSVVNTSVAIAMESIAQCMWWKTLVTMYFSKNHLPLQWDTERKGFIWSRVQTEIGEKCSGRDYLKKKSLHSSAVRKSEHQP